MSSSPGITGSGESIAVARSIVEPHAGGRWYGIDKNGDEHGIGHVVAYEPPQRLVLTWEISHDWQYDPSLKTEIEVRFIAESANIDEIDPEVADAPIVRSRIDGAKLERVLSNSFGFGGTNATLVFERYAA